MKKCFYIMILFFLMGSFVSGDLSARRASYGHSSWDKLVYSKKIGNYLKVSLALVTPVSQKKMADQAASEVFKEVLN